MFEVLEFKGQWKRKWKRPFRVYGGLYRDNGKEKEATS